MKLVTGDIEQAVYACLLGEARQLGCEILAMGGMPDHVHVAMRLSAQTSISDVARRMKGVSSTLVRKQLRPGETVAWQDGYAALQLQPLAPAARAGLHPPPEAAPRRERPLG
jgi:putative transposase